MLGKLKSLSKKVKEKTKGWRSIAREHIGIEESEDYRDMPKDYLVVCDTFQEGARLGREFADLLSEYDELKAVKENGNLVITAEGEHYRFIGVSDSRKFERGFRGTKLGRRVFRMLMSMYMAEKESALESMEERL